MTKFALATTLWIFAALSGSEAQSVSPLEFGMQMCDRAYQAVCWYSTLKTFPNTDTDAFRSCDSQVTQQMDFIRSNDFFKQYPSLKEEYVGKFINDQAMKGIADIYSTNCGEYLRKSKAKPISDESDALNDGKNVYPYRAFVYCLMSTLRDTYGESAIESVKKEQTHTKINWMQAMLDRENEFRVRHGVEPLQLMKDLNDAAQSWADTNANECDMHHTTNAQRKWKGEDTGENIASDTVSTDDMSAYVAADGWYEENKNYPFPQGISGMGDPLFGKVGHFTQSVWKGSKYVGYASISHFTSIAHYGLANNPSCKERQRFTRYVVARYYPLGNIDGAYPNNVMPPQS